MYLENPSRTWESLVGIRVRGGTGLCVLSRNAAQASGGTELDVRGVFVFVLFLSPSQMPLNLSQRLEFLLQKNQHKSSLRWNTVTSLHAKMRAMAGRIFLRAANARKEWGQTALPWLGTWRTWSWVGVRSTWLRTLGQIDLPWSWPSLALKVVK